MTASCDVHAWRVAALSMMVPVEIERLLAGEPRTADTWVRAAAEYGLAEAQVRLGRMLLSGEGVTKDEAAALAWFRRAADAGDTDAENMVGRCYENGWGVAADASRAAGWFARAAAKGHAWAQYNLGHLLLDGNGVPRDLRAAFAHYLAAARQGHARAMNLVGRCQEEGWGTTRDRDAARDWYRKSAQGGYFRGQYNHASVLAAEGCLTAALVWLARALDQAPEPALSAMLAQLQGNAQPALRALAARHHQAKRSSGRPTTRASCSSSARFNGSPPP